MSTPVGTPEDVEFWVARVRAVKADDEAAHALEDEIHVAVLRAIASNTATDPRAMAAAALKTIDIDFARWCA